MTNLSRRNLLIKGMALSGIAATQLPHPVSYGAELAAAPLTSALSGEGKSLYDKAMRREHEELRKFRRLLREEVAMNDKALRPGAISIPFATAPMNFYCRLTDTQKEMPEPQIPLLHESLCWGQDFRAVVAVRYLCALPKGAKFVEKLDLELPPRLAGQKRSKSIRVKPQRVVTPEYVVDVEEPCFGMRTTARMIIDSAEGLIQELNSQIECMLNYFVDSDGYRPPFEMQCLAPQICVTREAFMLQFMAWVTSAGCTRIASVQPAKHIKLHLST